MRVLTLMLLVLAAPAFAADPDPAAGEAARYDIELVLFLRHANPGGEYWPDDQEAPSPALAVATVQGGMPPRPLAAPAGEVATARPDLVTPLAESEYQLKAHAEALRRQGLTPLLHVAWRQAVGGRDNQDWLWLEAPPVRGLVRVSVARYLHLDSDLALLPNQVNPDASGVIRATERRRMRSDELHYLDHPGLGLLVLIRPHENDVPEMAPVTQP